MKNKSKTIFFTVLLLAVLVSILVYMYVYKAKKEETAQLKASNDTLETRVLQLKVYYDHMEEYKANIEQYTKDIFEMIKDFPADVLEEDAIYLALHSVGIKDATSEDALLPVRFTNIGIDPRAELGTIPAEKVTAAEIEELKSAVSFIDRKTIYKNITNYMDLKSLLSNINNYPEQLSISDINYTINENMLLDGAVEVHMYGVRGTDKEYKPKNFSDYEYGLSDLFGTQDSVVENPTVVNETEVTE